MPQDLKMREAQKMRDIGPAPGIEIVNAKDFMPFAQQSFAKVRTEKAGPTGNKNALPGHLFRDIHAWT
jgi:hypothetical protein